MLTKSELNEWKQNETTKKILKIFREETDRCIAAVGSGNVIGESADLTAQNVCRLVGRIQGLSKIFDLNDEVDLDEDE